jgi:hypothetical protein
MSNEDDEFLRIAEEYRLDDAYIIGEDDLIELCKKVQDKQREKDALLADVHSMTAHTIGNAEEFRSLAAAIRKGE